MFDHKKAMATPDFRDANQEMPPPGGFKRFKYTRGVPVSRGPPGWSLFAGTILMTSLGYYYVGQGNKERRALAQEERECKITLLPFLQSEMDAEYVSTCAESQREEARIMKDYPGYKEGESMYHSKNALPLYEPKSR